MLCCLRAHLAERLARTPASSQGGTVLIWGWRLVSMDTAIVMRQTRGFIYITIIALKEAINHLKNAVHTRNIR
jgi:hypothetical protein